MSILIKGMKKPKSCNACMFDVYGLCLINSNIEGDDELTHSCPLIELPPHGRLIDADALKIYQMEENVRADGDPNEYEYDAGLIDGLHMAAKDVSVAPTIIPAEGGENDV